MPRLPIDYSKTIIYKIVCKDINIKECYVGQTTNFTDRKNCHKKSCINPSNKSYNIYVYQFIREHNGWENWDMIEIEKYKAIDKLDAGKKERFYIENLQSTLNKVIPTRPEKEYKKKYKTLNKDKIKEQDKQYRELNKDKIKEYYKLNKDKIKENRSELITCICGSTCSKRHIRRHEQSAKHIEFVKTI